MKKKSILIIVMCLLMHFNYSYASSDEARLLRFPDINNESVVFSYAGDLFLVNSEGGLARRLTSHIGYEMFPKFSPDGSMIAFTAQYDGNTEVYVIPSQGGVPKRLTFSATLGRDDVGDRMGPNNIVLGWTPDGKRILYRTRSYTFNDFTGQLMTVPAEGGLPEKVPLKNGGFASFSPDGSKLAYNYIFREFRSWKRYTGGMADDIRLVDFNTNKSVRISDNIYQDVFPMWNREGDKVFYISDRDGYMNLYCWDSKSGETKQLTTYSEYDIKFPSSDGEFIVYENGGYIIKYDIKKGISEKVEIRIADDIVYARPEWRDLSSSVRSYSLSPNGERVLLTARGDLFSVPVKNGVTFNITNSSSSNDKNGEWSPDGRGFAYISDKEGEFNIYYRENSTGKEMRLTDIKGYIFGFKWSPDSKKILWSEKMNTLNLLDVKTATNEVIERSGLSPINDYNWSPCSRYLVYTRPQREASVVVLYDTNQKKKTEITDTWFSSGQGNFSKDGNYLLFVSNRHFSPTYGSTEWNHVYTNMSKIYLLPLYRDGQIPFALLNDTVKIVSEADKGESGKKRDAEPAREMFLSDIGPRIIEIPVAPSVYSGLHMIGNSVYYNSRRGSFVFDIDTKKETDLKARIIFGPGYRKALALSAGKIQVVDIPKSAVNINNPMSLSGVKKLVDYRKEWEQIYSETWRQMRDFFYAKNMHGVNWDTIYDRYKVLVPHVAHRSDLTYIIGEMIGELNVGHAYSQNGEKPEPARVNTGLLGAVLSRDKSGFFRVDSIIEGANWTKETRSPLTMPGVDVKEGDYILAVNGRLLTETENIYEFLAGTANVMTELEVNNSPNFSGSRKVYVEPLSDESALYYHSWVQNNIRKVSEATNGEVGYIHIPDMGVTGLNEFVKHYYPQLTKKALIIDDRGNGGGNVSPMIIERLLRTITYFTMHTNQSEGSLNPVGTFHGPKVLLVNEYSASDGDLFPYRFKHYNMGTVIGRRTWGGVVGYSGTIPVVDGGSIVTPSYAPFAEDGSGWIIEGEGVYPDIDIENDPYKEFMGIDQQLNKAIEVIIKEMESFEYKLPVIPEFPDKSPAR